ncbi:MAG: histidine phosphatase family protein [Alphaproteobacteria bacterium]|nr:histidine phosphatase family protein [Alphaproteobacteria bacterium]MDX5369610.1 histidine phosphatase family protein [Alphaproteobacteria bacterium]MDX5464261.1 histidine phosphatase family protein [Alphaproteobacteria bacterium]
MRILLLFRHAKSSWTDPKLDDHDRPLNRRGRDAAPAMARYMAAEGLVPDFVWCSTARRAHETLDLWSLATGRTPPVEYRRDLYLAGVATIVSTVRRTDDAHRMAMLVGHNPGLAHAAQDLLADRDSPEAVEMSLKFPTAAVAVISFPVDRWAGVTPGTGKLERYLTPRRVSGLADED